MKTYETAKRDNTWWMDWAEKKANNIEYALEIERELTSEQRMLFTSAAALFDKFGESFDDGPTELTGAPAQEPGPQGQRKDGTPGPKSLSKLFRF